MGSRAGSTARRQAAGAPAVPGNQLVVKEKDTLSPIRTADHHASRPIFPAVGAKEAGSRMTLGSQMQHLPQDLTVRTVHVIDTDAGNGKVGPAAARQCLGGNEVRGEGVGISLPEALAVGLPIDGLESDLPGSEGIDKIIQDFFLEDHRCRGNGRPHLELPTLFGHSPSRALH
jgi:hypothetical protein